MSIQYMNIHGERVAVEDKVLRDNVGDTALLTTNAKKVVDAINELKASDGACFEITYDEGSSTLTIVDTTKVTNV